MPAAGGAETVIVDTHAHLTHERFSGELCAVLDRAREAGVTQIVNVGFDLPSSREAVALAGRCPGCFAAIGVHPHEARTFDKRAEEDLRQLARDARVVAIGETGLDYHYEFSPREDQRRAFSALLALCHEAQLPAIIHDRQAHEDTLAVLAEVGVPPRGAVLHCFSGDAHLAEKCVEQGLYIGVTGIVTFRNAEQLRQVVRSIPLERLLVETDCPYLAPAPYRGKRNEPAFVRFVVEEVARLRGLDFEEVAHVTAQNARRLFALPSPP